MCYPHLCQPCIEIVVQWCAKSRFYTMSWGCQPKEASMSKRRSILDEWKVLMVSILNKYSQILYTFIWNKFARCAMVSVTCNASCGVEGFNILEGLNEHEWNPKWR